MFPEALRVVSQVVFNGNVCRDIVRGRGMSVGLSVSQNDKPRHHFRRDLLAVPRGKVNVLYYKTVSDRMSPGYPEVWPSLTLFMYKPLGREVKYYKMGLHKIKSEWTRVDNMHGIQLRSPLTIS